MAVNVIKNDKAPGAVGPYSQGIKAGNILFASGQIALNPETGKLVGGGVTAEATQCMKNVGALLEAAGMTYDNVVKTTVYITNMSYFGAVNAVYGEYFKNNLPARSCVAVAELPKGASVEVEVTAYAE